MNELMLDIETLGVRPRSIIVSIGAVVFQRHGAVLAHEFYANVEARTQASEYGLTTDESTLAFWNKPENQTARKRLEKNPKPIRLPDALEKLSKFYREHRCERIWSHGAPFDVVLVEEAMRACNWHDSKIPWRFHDVRDTRTLFELVFKLPERDLKKYPKHEAVADAKYQAVCVQHVCHTLGVS